MFDNLLVKRLTLGSGRCPGGASQQLELSGLTVFVGPNNSGKSLAISEIYESGYPKPSENRRIVTGLEFEGLNSQESEEVVRIFTVEAKGPNLHTGYIS